MNFQINVVSPLYCFFLNSIILIIIFKKYLNMSEGPSLKKFYNS